MKERGKGNATRNTYGMAYFLLKEKSIVSVSRKLLTLSNMSPAAVAVAVDPDSFKIITDWKSKHLIFDGIVKIMLF